MADQVLHYDRLLERAGGLADSHLWLVGRVPDGATVLDCGCAGGYVARALRQRGCVVDGIEIDPAAAERSRSICRSVHVGSLDDPSFLAGLRERYDRILFGDVLEHLVDPGAALRAMAGRLQPNGRILISIPNIAHWSVRFALLRGRFDYAESGLLDRTHLRFFTYETAAALVTAAGFRICVRDLTARGTRGAAHRPVLRRIHHRIVRAFPNLFAYQTLLEVEPCPE